MERFLVTHDGEGLWSVSHQGRTLYVYSTEEEARLAALALAADASQTGIAATVVITPAEISGELRTTQ